MQQDAVELVQCRSVDLEAPASAEILIEGFLHPGVRVVDGPYFDYAGKALENPDAFLFEATHVTYRSAPIFRGAVVGHPGAEDLQLLSVLSDTASRAESPPARRDVANVPVGRADWPRDAESCPFSETPESCGEIGPLLIV